MPLLIGLVLIGYALVNRQPPAPAPAAPATPPTTPAALVGRWQRTDGDYLLEIRSVDASGAAEVSYFNPRPIHVAKAQVQISGDSASLYVELRDAGYPGNSYRLSYDRGQDLLVGTYQQPEAQQQFQVCFEQVR